MKRKPRWHKLEVVLSKPNERMKSLNAILEEKELGRWLAKHLEQGYTITVTAVEQTATIHKLKTA